MDTPRPPLTTFPPKPESCDHLAATLAPGGSGGTTARGFGERPGDPGQGQQHMAKHLVGALTAAGEFSGLQDSTLSSVALRAVARGGTRRTRRAREMPIAPSPAQSCWGGDPIVRRERPGGHGRGGGGHARFAPLRGSPCSSGGPGCIQGGRGQGSPILGAAAVPPSERSLPNFAAPTARRARAPELGAEVALGSAGMRGPRWRARSGKSPQPWAALAGLATKPRQDGPFASSWHSQSAPAALPGARGAPRPPQRWPPATPPAATCARHRPQGKLCDRGAE